MFLRVTFLCEVVRAAQPCVGWDTSSLKAHGSQPGAPSHPLSAPLLRARLKLPCVAHTVSVTTCPSVDAACTSVQRLAMQPVLVVGLLIGGPTAPAWACELFSMNTH